MTKEQQEILEQDRKDTQEHIDSLSQEDLDNIPVEEDLISDEELQDMQGSFDILLEQYTSNLDEIEKYKDMLRNSIDDDLNEKGHKISLFSINSIKLLFKQLNKENKILLEEIKSTEFDIAMNSTEVSLDMNLDKPIITEEQARVLYKYDNTYVMGKNSFDFKGNLSHRQLEEIKKSLPRQIHISFTLSLEDFINSYDSYEPIQRIDNMVNRVEEFFDIIYVTDLDKDTKLIIAFNK